jgi:hypothetical protein
VIGQREAELSNVGGCGCPRRCGCPLWGAGAGGGVGRYAGNESGDYGSNPDINSSSAPAPNLSGSWVWGGRRGRSSWRWRWHRLKFGPVQAAWIILLLGIRDLVPCYVVISQHILLTGQCYRIVAGGPLRASYLRSGAHGEWRQRDQHQDRVSPRGTVDLSPRPPRPFQDHDVSPRMVNGRSILRLAQRVASVVSWRPARWRAPMARFLRAAMILGPDRVRTVDLSSW